MPNDRQRGDPSVAVAQDLQPYNTFGLPARAARLVPIASVDAVRALVRDAGWAASPRLVLGGGSNIVFTGDFPGCVLKVEIGGRALVRTDDEAWYVRAAAGEDWHDFVCWTLAQGWPGLENLSLIPGTVGAAPIQNIGAYGLELCERFESLEAVSLDDGGLRVFSRDTCRFGYRDSVFKREEAGRWMVTAVTFRLPRRWQAVTGYGDLAAELERRGFGDPTPTQVAEAVVAIRRRKLPDPSAIGNAGSFFKNPVIEAAALEPLLREDPAMPHYRQPDGRYKLAAGWLIDRCGWKGRSIGPVGCFETQALVLVNRGGATGADVLRLAHRVREDVAARFGIDLEPEPLIV